MEHLKDILTVDELAEILGCSVTTLEECHRNGTLLGIRFGNGGLRYTRESVLRQLEAQILQKKQPTQCLDNIRFAGVAAPARDKKPPALVPMMGPVSPGPSSLGGTW